VPLVAPVARLAEAKVPNVHGPITASLRAGYDHKARATERVVADRDLLNSVLEANLTQVGIRQNEDMRKISAWVAIGVVPTLLAGIYGMNLRHMPLLEHDAAFPIVVGVMVGIAVGLFALFRRRDWL
jgi:magnesium transporter